MDIYHTGREDKEDDHKFVNERLLEVAIPEEETDRIVTLEDCLETYFNNRIEVKRYLQRKNTMASMRSKSDEFVDRDPEKAEMIHIETAEMDEPMTPLVSSPVSMEPASPLSPSRPNLDTCRRADSIFGRRYTRQLSEARKFDEKKHVEDMLDSSSSGRPRSASLLKKEILMPAWQFFSLIRKLGIPSMPVFLTSCSLVHRQRSKVRCPGSGTFFCKTPGSRHMPQAVFHDSQRDTKASRYLC